jgi:polar amino acid transport system permease protein
MATLADIKEYLPTLWAGVWLTLEVSLGSLVLSTVMGLLLATFRISGIKALDKTAKGIIAITRGLPAMVQVFYIYFVLPDYGLALNAMVASIIGLGIAHAGYQAENFRAGIDAIDHGQAEAADSLGMGWFMKMRRVILPQAVKIMLPAYGNSTVGVLKDSSLASTITVGELSLQGKLLAASTFENTIVYTMVAVLYLGMCLPLMSLNGWLERRMGTK